MFIISIIIIIWFIIAIYYLMQSILIYYRAIYLLQQITQYIIYASAIDIIMRIFAFLR